MPGRYDDLWNLHIGEARTDELHDNTGYSERELIQHHLSVFMDLPGMEEEPRHIKYDLWGDYLDAMVSGHATRDERESFFADVGIYAADFDWAAWREAMGY